MKMNEKQKQFWVSKALSTYKLDQKLSTRVKTAWPLYGLRWVLIILKDTFRYDAILKTGEKIEIKKIDKLLQKQLIKSKYIVQEIVKNNYVCPYVR